MTRTVIDRSSFLTASLTRRKADVPLPEYGDGCVIPVWGMTARERTEFEKSFTGKSGKTIDDRVREFRERLVLTCCRNDDGVQIFTPEDIAALGATRADVIERIVNKCQELSGMTNQDIEDTVKNSVETQHV